MVKVTNIFIGSKKTCLGVLDRKMSTTVLPYTRCSLLRLNYLPAIKYLTSKTSCLFSFSFFNVLLWFEMAVLLFFWFFCFFFCFWMWCSCKLYCLIMWSWLKEETTCICFNSFNVFVWKVAFNCLIKMKEEKKKV